MSDRERIRMELWRDIFVRHYSAGSVDNPRRAADGVVGAFDKSFPAEAVPVAEPVAEKDALPPLPFIVYQLVFCRSGTGKSLYVVSEVRAIGDIWAEVCAVPYDKMGCGPYHREWFPVGHVTSVTESSRHGWKVGDEVTIKGESAGVVTGLSWNANEVRIGDEPGFRNTCDFDRDKRPAAPLLKNQLVRLKSEVPGLKCVVVDSVRHVNCRGWEICIRDRGTMHPRRIEWRPADAFEPVAKFEGWPFNVGDKVRHVTGGVFTVTGLCDVVSMIRVNDDESWSPADDYELEKPVCAMYAIGDRVSKVTNGNREVAFVEGIMIEKDNPLRIKIGQTWYLASEWSPTP